MEIGSREKYPSSALSNFYPHPFVIDGVQCASMEGFLQSLKFENPDVQMQVCGLVGMAAKRRGRNKPWWRKQILYWKGVGYGRDSDEYQALLNRAYTALAQNAGFRKALLATHKAVLKHSIGGTDTHRTVLTRREFCSRLTKIREQLQKGEEVAL